MEIGQQPIAQKGRGVEAYILASGHGSARCAHPIAFGDFVQRGLQTTEMVPAQPFIAFDHDMVAAAATEHAIFDFCVGIGPLLCIPIGIVRFRSSPHIDVVSDAVLDAFEDDLLDMAPRLAVSEALPGSPSWISSVP
jgi:hypothetical protein